MRLLRTLGQQVECAANGDEAVRMAAENRYDAVLMTCRCRG